MAQDPQPINPFEAEAIEAMKNGEYDRAHALRSIQAQQEEMNRIRNQRIEQAMFSPSPMFVMNPNVKLSYAIDPAAQTDWQTESIADYAKRQELDQRRNFKLFLHHAKLLSERYPNWTVQPDPNNPFKNITITHKNNKYKIESGYPNNEIKVWGVETEQLRRTKDFASKFGVPYNIFNMSPYTVNMPTFYGWCIGMEDVPSWVTE